MRIPIEGPDVICVGLPKAGTGWLFDQLNGHPDFWMPPGKELRFFLGGDFPPRHVLRSANLWKRQGETASGRKFDERDIAFFKKLPNPPSKTRDLDLYASLFSAKGDLLSGDISPIYAAMRQREVRKIAARFGETRVVALLRDPVERAWSHWRMDMSKDGDPDPDLVQNVAALRKYLSNRRMAARSKPTRVVNVWSKAFRERFRYFFLEDIAAHPVETRAEILSFIGGDPSKESRFEAGHNSKAGEKVGRGPEVQKLMKELFTEERRLCAEKFGGPALAWPDAPY